MARRHRIQFCGAIYHVMARGNRKEPIFVDDVDRRRFLKIVAAALEKFGAECYVHCLMDNHFHKVIHTPRANIARVMQHIDGLYTQYENWRHGTTGHCWRAAIPESSSTTPITSETRSDTYCEIHSKPDW